MASDSSFLKFRLVNLLVILLLLSGCKVSLYSGLSEAEANQIISVLHTHNIVANKDIDTRSGTATVMVQETDFSAAVELLNSKGYPKQKFATTEQVFNGSGIVQTSLEEQARLRYVISQELSSTISELDGVLSARVHIVIPQQADIRAQQDQAPELAKASVFIRRTDDIMMDNMVSNIKHFVSNSVPNLDYENVAVIDFIVPASTFDTDMGERNAAVSVGYVSFLSSAVIVIVLLFVGLGVAFAFVFYRRSNLNTNRTDPAENALPSRNVVAINEAVQK